MKKVVVLLALCAFAGSLWAGDGRVGKSQRARKGAYIVRFADITTDVEARASHILSIHGGKVRHYFPGEPWSGFSVENLPEAAASAISRNPVVESVDEVAIAEPAQVQTPPLDWALDRIEQQYLPLNGLTFTTNVLVNIYILDSGVNDPRGTEFGTRLVNGYTPVPGYFADPVKAGHGTRVASLAAGNTYGVARAATVHNVKISTDADTPDVEIDRVIAGIRTYVNPTAAATQYRDVANLSYFWITSSQLLDIEIRNSIKNFNVTWVVAAGNGLPGTGIGTDACQGTPARIGRPDAEGISTITVGATKLEWDSATSSFRDARSSFSNYGGCVDLFAPGEAVKVPDFNVYTNQWFDTTGSGTSFAAPLVTGQITSYINGLVTTTPAQAEQTMKDLSTTKDIINSATLQPGVSNCLTTNGCATPNLLMYQRRSSRH